MDQNLQDAITQLVQGQLASGLAQMQAQLSAAVSQQQQLTAAAIAASQTQSAPQAPSGPAEEEEAWTSETAWEDVLPVLKRPANAGAGEALVARLAHPPPLEKLKELQKDITGIVGIPATVPARKNFRDKQLQLLQTKQEQILVLLTHAVEQTDCYDGPLITAAALARSTWEDLQDWRRKDFAGRDAHKLDRRSDSSSLRLLSPAEEKIVTPQRGKGKGKGKGFRPFQPANFQPHGYPNQQQGQYSNSSSNFRPWKGGKGKGRSRSAQPNKSSSMQE